jgi:SAM-dependent methyltransferase
MLYRRIKYHVARLPLIRPLVERFGRRARSLASFSRDLAPGELTVEGDPVTERLFDRLAAEDVAEIERQIEGHDMFRELSTTVDGDAERHRFLLNIGIVTGVSATYEKTGLVTALPPEDVHAMSRGPMAAAGALYEADMVASTLLSAGIDPATVRAGLDFGSSSGRVVRVMQAAYPHVSWHGCDPNTEAIEWASAHLPGVEFFTSANEPPLPLADAALDLVYAISIWSHFEPELGLRWFDEMHRLIEPGGHLMLTTHGLTAIDDCLVNSVRSAKQCTEIRKAMYSSGSWYAAEFGDRGDWGVFNPLWGTAFVSPEWLLAKLLPRWQVLVFAPGRNHGNQDVYLLRRV